MKTIPISEFRKLNREGMEAIAPAIILYDGFEVGVFCAKDKVVVIEDLHPRMQQKIKALEEIARMGLPKVTKVYADEVI